MIEFADFRESARLPRMAKIFERIDESIRSWIAQQKMFFVSTAPTVIDGHINCSPKGYDSFRILDDTTVAYRDLTGSGIETVAHLKDNGRIVIMFCAFEGPPKIVRFHGEGEVLEPDHEDFGAVAAAFGTASDAKEMGTRAFIRVRVSRISDSCGYSVPLYHYVSDRDILLKWNDNKGADGVKAYQSDKNAVSIDGLPGLNGVCA
ncbi:MAG: pyridoxamine 5'-phosphate oxidase family protein [Verrucomicrobia bacterium]|nr:pyridoxamine 5'-phosphate oxidase family protein [Verrucomicrobiota bacterium]